MGWYDTTEAWLEKLNEHSDFASINQGAKAAFREITPEPDDKGRSVDVVGMKPLTEAQWATQVESLLELGKWRWVHFRPARVLRHGKETYETPYSGHKGFLDYLCLRLVPTARLVILELKGEKGKLSLEQKVWFQWWLTFSKLCPLVEVHLLRPSDFVKVREILK